MLPLEKNRVRLDDDSDEDRGREEEQEGTEQSMAGVEQQSEAPPPQPEEKKPTLSQEELEAKQGGVTATHTHTICENYFVNTAILKRIAKFGTSAV